MSNYIIMQFKKFKI